MPVDQSHPLETSSPVVRLAGPEDEQKLYDFLKGLHGENGLFPLDKTRALETIKKATDHQGGLAGIIEGPDGIEASVGLFLDRWWYTDQWQLTELWLFVDPKFRGMARWDALIAWAKACADQMKLPLQIGVVSADRAEAKIRLYRKRLPLAGGLFVYGLPEFDASTLMEAA